MGYFDGFASHHVSGMGVLVCLCLVQKVGMGGQVKFNITGMSVVEGRDARREVDDVPIHIPIIIRYSAV